MLKLKNIYIWVNTKLPAFVIISPEGTVIKKMDGYAIGKLRKEINNYLNPPTDNQ